MKLRSRNETFLESEKRFATIRFPDSNDPDNAARDASLSRAFHGRIAGCRSLCNFVTSSIRPCNSVITRNDPAARPAGCACTDARGPLSYPIPPPPCHQRLRRNHLYTEWDTIRLVAKLIERFGNFINPNFDLEDRIAVFSLLRNREEAMLERVINEAWWINATD